MELLDFEAETGKKSPIHNLDPRGKIISFLLIIGTAVYLGRGEALFYKKLIGLAILEGYLIFLLSLSRLRISLFLKRLSLVVPFGGAIAAMKIFFSEGGIGITRNGIEQGATLFSIMIVCATSVLLLSSTTPQQSLMLSLRSLRLPRELSILLSMSMRYVFFYFVALKKITEAQATRLSSPRKLFAWKNIGDTIGIIFIRSYEQGFKTYQSMLSRGYNPNSNFLIKKNSSFRDVCFVLFTVIICASILGLQKIFIL
jgi:cobalt/nickel transport system permease protein